MNNHWTCRPMPNEPESISGVGGRWGEKFLTVGITSTGRFIVGRWWRHSACAAASGQCQAQLFSDFRVIGLVNVVKYATSGHFHLKCKSQPWNRALSFKSIYFNSFNLLRWALFALSFCAIGKGFLEFAKTIKSNKIGCMQVTKSFRYLFRTLPSPIWISRPRLEGVQWWEVQSGTLAKHESRLGSFRLKRQRLHTKSFKCLRQ